MNAYQLLLTAHISGGGIGLASLAVPLLSTKGGRLHRRAGWIFVFGMSLSSLTGLAITVLWLAWPTAIRPNADPERVRAFAMFLGALSLLTLDAIWMGIRSLTRKRIEPTRPRFLDVALPIVLGLAGLITGVFGVVTSRGLLIFFGLVEIANAIPNLRFVLRPLSSKRAWWYQHMRGMSVAGITAVTAFLVVAMGRTLGDALPASLRFVPWVAPSLLAVPSLMLWIRSYQRRFGER